MNIGIFDKYKVTCKFKYTYMNEDEDWVEKSDKWEKSMDGIELIKIINNHLTDKDFFSINAQDNFIHIENFDPMSGETASYNIKYEEI